MPVRAVEITLTRTIQAAQLKAEQQESHLGVASALQKLFVHRFGEGVAWMSIPAGAAQDHCGWLPCLRLGTGVYLLRSVSRALMRRERVSAGSMTSSTRPRSAA